MHIYFNKHWRCTWAMIFQRHGKRGGGSNTIYSILRIREKREHTLHTIFKSKEIIFEPQSLKFDYCGGQVHTQGEVGRKKENWGSKLKKRGGGDRERVEWGWKENDSFLAVGLVKVGTVICRHGSRKREDDGDLEKWLKTQAILNGSGNSVPAKCFFFFFLLCCCKQSYVHKLEYLKWQKRLFWKRTNKWTCWMTFFLHMTLVAMFKTLHFKTYLEILCKTCASQMPISLSCLWMSDNRQ